MEYISPLRYPGGKAGLAPLLGEIIRLNDLRDPVYAEPYAGGAGAALSLLVTERVSRVLINDVDFRLAAFWQSILRFPERFVALLEDTPVTIDEWHRQRKIYLHPRAHSTLRVGFATFFLNRCNRSGILVSGGPIGGYSQAGKWKLDARFNRADLRRRIERIVEYRDRIEVSNLDALDFLRSKVEPTTKQKGVFVYLDPPYFQKGSLLYFNSYRAEDHEQVASYLRARTSFRWILSYDNVPEITNLYSDFQRTEFGLRYTAYSRRSGQEILIAQKGLKKPADIMSFVARRGTTPEASVKQEYADA